MKQKLSITVVPCPPCLRQILRGEADEPHQCNVTTFVSIDAGKLIVGPEQDCPCPCQTPMVESEAL
ncbi:hypothetical protein [Streptomyces formicae]